MATLRSAPPRSIPTGSILPLGDLRAEPVKLVALVLATLTLPFIAVNVRRGI